MSINYGLLARKIESIVAGATLSFEETLWKVVSENGLNHTDVEHLLEAVDDLDSPYIQASAGQTGW